MAFAVLFEIVSAYCDQLFLIPTTKQSFLHFQLQVSQTTAGQPPAHQNTTAAQLNALAAASGGPTGGSLPTVSLALASGQALQTFAQSGAHAAVIPSVTAAGGLAAPAATPSQAASAAKAAAAAAAAAQAAAAGNPYSGKDPVRVRSSLKISYQMTDGLGLQIYFDLISNPSVQTK